MCLCKLVVEFGGKWERPRPVLLTPATRWGGIWGGKERREFAFFGNVFVFLACCNRIASVVGKEKNPITTYFLKKKEIKPARH